MFSENCPVPIPESPFSAPDFKFRVERKCNLKAVFWLFSLPFFFAVSASAQTLNLKEALETGAANYPAIKARQADVKSAGKKVSSARAAYIPDLNVQHQYTFGTGNNVVGPYYANNGTTINPSGGDREENIYQGAFGSLSTALLEWDVFSFGKVKANIDAAKAEEKTVEMAYENELFQHQIRIADAYLLLLTNQRLKETQRQNLLRAEAFKKAITAATLSGLRAGVDSSLANAELAKARIQLLEAEKNERSQLYKLAELTGEVKELNIDSMAFFSRLPNPQSHLHDDITQTPLLRLYSAQTELSRRRATAIKRRFYPTFTLMGATWARGSGISNKTGEYRTDFASGTQYQVYNYMVGAAVRWNITDFFQVRNDFQAENFQRQRHEYLYQEQQLKLSRQLKESDMQFQLSMEQAKVAPLQLQAAQAGFRQAQSRYESGLTDLPTFTQSLVTLNRAETDRYIAYINAWRSLLLEAASTGDLSIFLNQVQ
ncbi:TolC family protein [Adhaeribacter sp. BT258]|uniref:TolC family protein n=1 Tax=Adhaeribacter terrigena TaxID=2793070 RepID=A0ABS1C1U4_9BACT|nr:TolC family protein [Adhaeribacter terrigena]MBK0403362.1 TolC family protein [Adhaeribacter terrigena]